MSEDKLSKEEQELFNLLPREKAPPYSLEKKLLNKLKDEGLISRSKKRIPLKWAAAVAASVLFFFGGMMYERADKATVPEINAMQGYLLLLHADHRFTPGDPIQMFNEYKGWMVSTIQQGVKIKGQELKEASVSINDSSASDLHILGRRTTGYFILEAETLEKAIEIAKGNPHTKYGGTIEVKPFMVR